MPNYGETRFVMQYSRKLDGVRGLAILAVLIGHSPFLFVTRSSILEWYSPLVDGGVLGVDLFFVLSGFLITSKLLEMHAERGRISFTVFYISRATRLLPALYVMLLIMSTIHMMEGVPVSRIWPTVVAAVFYVINFATTLSLPPLLEGMGHLWSLSVEEQFYIFWPMVLVVATKRRARAVVVALLVAAVSVGMWRIFRFEANPGWFVFIRSRTDIRMDGLLYGAVTAFVVREQLISRKLLSFLGSVGVVVIVLHLVLASITNPSTIRFGLALFNIACSLLIAALVCAPMPLWGVFEWKAMVLLGRISYGLYLWHLPIWIFVVRHSSSRSPLFVAPLSITLTAMLTALSWRFVEQPAMRLRPRLLEMFTRERTAAMSAR